MVCYLGRVYPGTCENEVPFVANWWVSQSLVGVVLHVFHDHALSGGHLAYKPTFYRSRERFWWSTWHRDVKGGGHACQACQQRKTAHNRPKIPAGHVPITRPFERVLVDLVEYKSLSLSPTGIWCKYARSVIDYLIRFALLIPAPNKAAEIVAAAIKERVFGIFGPPEFLYSDQGRKLKNQVMHQLRQVLNYKKTKATPCRHRGILYQNEFTPKYMSCWRYTVTLLRTTGYLPAISTAGP